MVSQPGSAALTYSPCARCRLGLIGDLGQTENSAQTLEHLAATRPASVINVGDLSYADGASPSGPLPPHAPSSRPVSTGACRRQGQTACSSNVLHPLLCMLCKSSFHMN